MLREQRLNSSENPLRGSTGGQPGGRKSIVLLLGEPARGIRNVCSRDGHREVPEHLYCRLPGSFARGPRLSPLTVESV